MLAKKSQFFQLKYILGDDVIFGFKNDSKFFFQMFHISSASYWPYIQFLFLTGVFLRAFVGLIL
jgi:hypothetical protein